jgi:nucleotide-binding universal stress UspA family protein
MADPITEYGVVLLVEQALSPQDARQVRSLHEGLDDPVTYHVLLPVDDAAARVEASLGSLSGSELLAAPHVPIEPLDTTELEAELREQAQADLTASVAELERAGATVASSTLVSGPPVDELAAKVKEVDGRETIILTRPHLVAQLLHLDWSAKARRRLDVPVLHLLEHETFDEQAAGPDGISGA